MGKQHQLASPLNNFLPFHASPHLASPSPPSPAPARPPAATLRMSYTMQLEAARRANVELFAWTWTMPFGGAFRPAWSLRVLLHLLGANVASDTRDEACG